MANRCRGFRWSRSASLSPWVSRASGFLTLSPQSGRSLNFCPCRVSEFIWFHQMRQDNPLTITSPANSFHTITFFEITYLFFYTFRRDTDLFSQFPGGNTRILNHELQNSFPFFPYQIQWKPLLNTFQLLTFYVTDNDARSQEEAERKHGMTHDYRIPALRTLNLNLMTSDLNLATWILNLQRI